MLASSKRIVPIVVKEDFSWDDVRPEIAKLNFIFFHHHGDEERFEMNEVAREAHLDSSFEELLGAIQTDYAYLQVSHVPRHCHVMPRH